MSTLFGTRKRKNEDISKKEKETTPRVSPNGKPESSSTAAHPEFQVNKEHLSFESLELVESLVATCKRLGLKRPTPVQSTVIPFLIQHRDQHVLSLAPTGSGKTAAFVLPILHHWQADPYGIYAVILTPTRELAQQIHQQVLALGSAYDVKSALVVGGLDRLKQSQALDSRPHFCVATPGRLAALLRGPQPPAMLHLKYLVLDEADRLLVSESGFSRDVAEVLVHVNKNKKTTCQTLLFSATMTQSLETIEELAGAGMGRLHLRKFDANAEKNTQMADHVEESNEKMGNLTDETKNAAIPPGLKQEYIFMPSRVRDAYLITAIRHLMIDGGRVSSDNDSGWNSIAKDDDEDEDNAGKARSAIVFVHTCERAALVNSILEKLGVSSVALHSYLSQNRRLASLAKFKSQQVRILVATDVASRGLDIPTVDLVIQSQLPRNATVYIHRVGRTARAGRRGRAISLVAESEVALVHSAEQISGRTLEKCSDVSDDMAIKLLGPVAKATRLAKIMLQDIGFDELVEKFKTRKRRAKKERLRLEKSLAKSSQHET